MSVASRLGLVALAAAAFTGAASGAAPSGLRLVEAGGSTFPAKSYILTLPAPKALSNSDVTVVENGTPVPGVSVVRQGTAKGASAVVLAIDESLTMEGKPSAAAFAAARAFAAAANPNESIAVVTFNGDVKVLQPFTTSAADINSALAKQPNFKYGTKVYDALEQSLGLIKSAGAPAASVIVLTDGQNVGSETSASAALGDLKKAHVRAFAVGLRSPAYHAAALQNMASTTGGSYVEASSPADLRPLLVKLGNRLSSEYLVNYTSFQNPSTKVVVAVSVKGFPGAVRTAYKTPALHIVPAAPYKPSAVNNVIQSQYVLFVVAILFALLIGFAIIIATSTKPEPLVARVGGFVSVTAGALTRAGRREEPEPHLAGDRARLAVGLVGQAGGDARARRHQGDPASVRRVHRVHHDPPSPHSRACSSGSSGSSSRPSRPSSHVRSCSIACPGSEKPLPSNCPTISRSSPPRFVRATVSWVHSKSSPTTQSSLRRPSSSEFSPTSSSESSSRMRSR